MRKITYILFGALLVSFAYSEADPPDTEYQYIYMIESSDCVWSAAGRVQTGFKLQGKKGLVTALHGVVDCSHITARRLDRSDTIDAHVNLKIEYVDVERDLAILGGETLQDTIGLVPHPACIPEAKEVFVLGHPQAIPKLWEMDLKLSSLELTILDNNIPPILRDAIKERGSPALWVRTLRINGNLQPGHSGAPIVDGSGRVVGVGSGGLGDGTLGIGWAIPICEREVQWLRYEDREEDLNELINHEPSLVFSQPDPDQLLPEPVVRSEGSGCIRQASFFDFDRGDSSPSNEEADLFFHAKTMTERFLEPNPYNLAELAVLGNRDFERVTPAALRRAEYGRRGINANRNSQNALPSGTVLAVHTSKGRFAKVQIMQSQGEYISFDWITYALPGEGPSPLKPSIEPCEANTGLLCGTGQLPGDSIYSFEVLDVKSSEITILVNHYVNPAHGAVWVNAYLLDKDGAQLSPGYISSAASPNGNTVVRVTRGQGQVRYLLIWMSGSFKSEAYACRQFDYRI